MKIAIITAIVLITASWALCDTGAETAVMSTVNQFVDSFNKGDVTTAVAACADEAQIIDEFAPYSWHGAGACSKWANDYDADAKKNGITEGVVVLSKPKHVDVTGEVAYVVVPANYTYKQNGKAVKETDSMLTVVLQKGAAGWRMTAWSWAKN